MESWNNDMKISEIIYCIIEVYNFPHEIYIEIMEHININFIVTNQSYNHHFYHDKLFNSF